jgi:hypothetical protein
MGAVYTFASPLRSREHGSIDSPGAGVALKWDWDQLTQAWDSLKRVVREMMLVASFEPGVTLSRHGAKRGVQQRAR